MTGRRVRFPAVGGRWPGARATAVAGRDGIAMAPGAKKQMPQPVPRMCQREVRNQSGKRCTARSVIRSSTPTAIWLNWSVLDDELLSYLEEAGGPRLRDRYLAGTAKPFDTSTALANRDHPAVREKWLAMPSWWGWQTRNTLDRATAHLPRLLYERLDEMGIDFTLLYPSAVLALVDLDDVELGRRWRAAPTAGSPVSSSRSRIASPSAVSFP